MGTRFILNENDRNDIRKMYGLFSEQLTGGTVNQQTNRPNNIPQTGGTTNRQANIPQSGTTKSISNRNPNRPTCDGKGLISLGCWLDEIDKVQREIGNPSTWTMDSYNRLQKTLNDYKTWRTTTPEGQAVQDSHNEKNEYVVQLPPHLQNLNESYLTRLVKGIVKEDLYENYRHRKSTK